MLGARVCCSGSLTKHSAPSSLPFYAPNLPSRRLMLMQYELPAGTEKAMQIVCTRLWRELHGRNASRLKRLKQDGGYIIEDNHFRFFASLAAPGGVDVRDVAGKYVMFTRGAVRGALVALGVGAAVHADWTKDFPGVRFRVQLDQTMFSGAV